MNNYTHEIPCPEDRAMRKFLWQDVFHDYDIADIDFDGGRGNTVVLRLEGEECYLLRFSGAEYFQCRRGDVCCHEWINGRFKDSALLHRRQKKVAKRLYHYRIGTGDGLIDIVFSRFSIRKEGGRVNYRMTGEPRLAYTVACLEDDGQLARRFLQMYKTGETGLAGELRACMASKRPLDDAKETAAYLLGKVGDIEDIPALLDLYIHAEEYYVMQGYTPWSAVMLRQNILDSIELIRERMGNV